jgi:hypothetical protein
MMHQMQFRALIVSMRRYRERSAPGVSVVRGATAVVGPIGGSLLRTLRLLLASGHTDPAPDDRRPLPVMPGFIDWQWHVHPTMNESRMYTQTMGSVVTKALNRV